jgi:hypothetical protein
MMASSIYFFFDKGNILISRRYQLHSASASTWCQETSRDIKDAHSQREKEKNKKGPSQSEQRVAAAHTDLYSQGFLFSSSY